MSTSNQSWATTQAALLTLVAALDDYALHLAHTGQIGRVEVAAYAAWRTAELEQLAAIGERMTVQELLTELDERAALQKLLAAINIEALFARKLGGG